MEFSSSTNTVDPDCPYSRESDKHRCQYCGELFAVIYHLTLHVDEVHKESNLLASTMPLIRSQVLSSSLLSRKQDENSQCQTLPLLLPPAQDDGPPAAQYSASGPREKYCTTEHSIASGEPHEDYSLQSMDVSLSYAVLPSILAEPGERPDAPPILVQEAPVGPDKLQFNMEGSPSLGCENGGPETILNLSPFGLVETDNVLHRALPTALTLPSQDEEQVLPPPYSSLMPILADHDRQANLFQLRGQEAQTYLDELQSFLSDSPLLAAQDSRPAASSSGTASREQRRTSFHVLRKLSAASQQLPRALFIQGVTVSCRMPTAGGGYADIFAGSYCGALVAMKRMRIFPNSEHQQREHLAKVFCRETIIGHHIRHPFILPFLGVHIEHNPQWGEDMLYIVSPWMENRTVNRYIKDRSLPADEVHTLVGGLASGVAFLHSEDVIHGDIRGDNVLVSAEGRPLLCDFGLTAFADEPPDEAGPTTRDLRRAGTVEWMASELLLTPDPRPTKETDRYAWACTVWEMFTESRPFCDTPNYYLLLESLRTGERPPRPTAGAYAGRKIDERLWETVQRSWAQDPLARPPMGSVVLEHWPELL